MSKKSADKAIKLFQAFQSIDENMSVSCALALLYSSKLNEQKTLEKSLGLSNAAASRNVAYWSKHFKHGVEGKDFIETYEDPVDRRNRLIRLKPKGNAFFERVREIIEGD